MAFPEKLNFILNEVFTAKHYHKFCTKQSQARNKKITANNDEGQWSNDSGNNTQRCEIPMMEFQWNALNCNEVSMKFIECDAFDKPVLSVAEF